MLVYSLYRSLTNLAAPLMPFWLEKRRKKGKEDSARLQERFGYASLARPEGRLLWIHAASVGECNAALPLISALLTTYPALHVLLTSGTVTSAQLMATRLPERAMHQFVPVDTPQAVERFMAHWQPDVALFIDSELWPNLIMATHASGAEMGLVNARMSEKSYKSWQFAKPLICSLLEKFTLCFAQSKDDAQRLRGLGIADVQHIGNVKYDVPPLMCDEAALAQLRESIGKRPVWVAASTHPGEEAMIAAVHQELTKNFPDILTIIVPRHAHRADEIVQALEGFSVARRSLQMPIFPETDIYLADTMGELGLFYRLAQVAFIGGSLVPHGGQNPIEALLLECPVIMGPHMENFHTVAAMMDRDSACITIKDSPMLAGAVKRLLLHPEVRQELVEAGRKHAKAFSGSLAVIQAKLQPCLAE